MRIRSFHIDGFGIFSDVGVESLAPGLTVFLGDNEAGKSTCLDFFRVMLTGYADPRSKEAKERTTAPLRGGTPGGSLALDTRRHGLLRLTRRPGPGGGSVALNDAQGNLLDLALLDQLMAGVTREVYRNVFGFSLRELQTFDSLDSDGVRHALYGASFGMGLRAPGQVLKALNDQMDALFKGSGSVPPLNKALREWEALRKEVQQAEEECVRFDALSMEKDTCTAALTDLRQRIQNAERLRRDRERQLGVWKQWDEWRSAGLRLERLEDVPETFPHDGPARLERSLLNRQEAARKLQLQEDRCHRFETQLEQMAVDEALLAALPRLHALAERKTSFRNAINALPSHAAALQRARAELARLLTGLGPGWDCDRIRATDRSLFAREELERQAAEMQTAHSTHVAAAATLEKANRSVEIAESVVLAARAALENLTVPAAELDDVGRDHLRRILAQMEDALTRLPEKKQALQAARATFARTFGPLRTKSGFAPEQILRQLSDAQEQALGFAASAQEAADNSQTTAQNVMQAQAAEEQVKGRIDRLRAQQRAHQGPTRSALDVRATAVRALRHLHSVFSMEQDRMAEAEARLAGMHHPAPLKSVPLICIGLALMLGGAAMLFAYWQMGITGVSLTPQLTLPVTLWSSYLVILTGVGFLAGGLPRSGPEAKRHAAELEQLKARRESIRLRLTELEAQVQEQCVLAEIVSADPVTLDATELLLEREREHCVTDERLNLEKAALEAELAAARERTRQAQSQSMHAESVVQQTRRRWHELMQSCHVETIPAPDAASVFFVKVEAARVALDSATALEAEVCNLEARLKAQSDAALAMGPVAAYLPKGAAVEGARPETDDVLEAIHRVLEACRAADAAEEERLRATAALQNAESNADLASTAQGEAMDALHRCEDTLGAAREAWASILEELGLGLELSPGTVREALECMERCLTAEAEVARLKDELTRLERERDALVLPLRTLEESLGRAAPDADTEEDAVDWANRLDALLAAAQAMDDASRRREHLTGQLEEENDELAALRSALADAETDVQELLTMACVDDAEAFLRLADTDAQRKELVKRREDLEDTLRLAADERPLEDFLASFENMDKQEREQQVVALTTEMAVLREEEQEVSARLATCSANLRSLTTADRLSALRQQEEDLRESMRHMAYDWSRHALARQLLHQAKQRFERERQPQVIRAASAIFAEVTDNRWSGLAASLEDSTLSVLPPHGEPIAPDQLSRGAQEQIYLAMRLAYIRNHAAHATPLPVIMDDILVNFDPVRAQRTAKALLGLTSGKGDGHQLLFFTCHPHTADMLQEIMPDSTRLLVDNGAIRKA